MIHNIKYRPLKAFLLAVDIGSFTEAAELLGVTQPSFTALIRDLENTLGFKLFERTTRRIVITAEGIDFCNQIRLPISDIELAYKNMLDLALARRGSIVMGALPSTALTIIPPALGLLRKHHPYLKVRVVEAHNDDLLSMLKSSQLEFILATVNEETPDIKFTPLVEDVFCAVYPENHPISSLKDITWQDLIPYDLIVLSKGSSARNQFENAIKDASIDSGLRSDVTHMSTAALLVHQNLGIALLPRLALPALGLEGLAVKPIVSASASRTIGLIQRANHKLSPASDTLAELLKRCSKV